MENYEIPAELLEDNKLSLEERAARIGRFLILQEMGFFGEDTNIDLSKNIGPGSWVARVRKRFSGTYGDVAGCHPADLEIAAEMLGVFDMVYDYEAVMVDDEEAYVDGA